MGKNKIRKFKEGEKTWIVWFGVILIMAFLVILAMYMWDLEIGPLKPVEIRFLS